MSDWMHINGSIRIDALRIMALPKLILPDFSQIFGQIVTFEDLGTWGKEKHNHILIGSEGSIRYQINTNPRKSNTSFATINFWGDLRDIDSFDVFEEWLKESLRNLEEFGKAFEYFTSIRQLVFEVNIESLGTRFYSVDDDGKLIIVGEIK